MVDFSNSASRYGVYTCKASNRIGESKKNFTLEEAGKDRSTCISHINLAIIKLIFYSETCVSWTLNKTEFPYKMNFQEIPNAGNFVNLNCINWTPVYFEHKNWSLGGLVNFKGKLFEPTVWYFLFFILMFQCICVVKPFYCYTGTAGSFYHIWEEISLVANIVGF